MQSKEEEARIFFSFSFCRGRKKKTHYELWGILDMWGMGQGPITSFGDFLIRSGGDCARWSTHGSAPGEDVGNIHILN